jgi:CheY-like chemotaxis protein
MPDVSGVLIVSGDWRSRALLRAQLIEEGCEVRAYESLRDAAGVLRISPEAIKKTSGFTTGLVVADLSENGTRHEMDQLLRLTQRVPVWVIASRRGTPEPELKGFERVFFRPVDMRDLVEEIKRRVGSREVRPDTQR